MKNYILLITVISILQVKIVFPQGYDPIEVPSPQAYSFFRYSEFPVNYSTGLPNINIPITTLKEGTLEVPVTLSYHAGTIKPREQVGWVGFGWDLNVGGVITRKIESIRDDKENIGWFFAKPDDPVIDDPDMIDGAPDVFSYSFNGHSGKFVLDLDNSFMVYPMDNIIVELITEDDDYSEVDGVCSLKDYWYPGVGLGETYFQGFRITSDDGTIYEFRQIEYSFPKGGGVSGPDHQVINTWYLTRIISANGKDEIKFTYQKPAANKFHIVTDPSLNSEEYHALGTWFYIKSKSYYTTSLNELVYPKEIKGSRTNQKIEFAISPKDDLPYPYEKLVDGFQPYLNCNYNGHKLDTIKISYKDEPIKYFNFNYNEQNGEWKMILTGLQELNASLAPVSPPYQFSYSTRHINYGSRVDHWGFYNYDGTILPAGLKEIDGRAPWRESYDIEDYPDILKKITYPTGGYTSFEWNQNTFTKVADDPYHELEVFKTNTLPPRDGDVYAAIKADPNLEDIFIEFNKYDTTQVFVSLVFNTLVHGNEAGCFCGGAGECDIQNIYFRGDKYGLNEIIDHALYHTFEVENSFCETGRNFYDSTMDGHLYNSHVKYCEYISSDFEYTGGVRINKITTYDNATGKEIVREFEYKLEDGKSSGVINTFPKYNEKASCYYWFTGDDPMYPSSGYASGEIAYASTQSLSPFSFTDGCHVNYSRVAEKRSDGARSVYYYTTFLDVRDERSSVDPRVIVIDNSMYRGKLIREEHYKSGETKPVETKNYTYQNIYLYDDNQYPVGIYGSKYQKYVTFTSGSAQGYFFNILPYRHEVRDFLLRSIRDTIDGVSSYTLYDNSRDIHNSYADLTVSKTIVGPNGESTFEKYIYPIDYESVDNGFIGEMKTSNIINKPVEQYTNKNGNVIKGTITEYNTGDEIGLPDMIYNLESDQPIASSSFVPSNQNGYSPSTYYKPLVRFDSYSSSGNLLQYHKENGNNISYVWGYNDMYVIAKVENAEIGKFAHTSFEDGFPEGWVEHGSILDYSGTNTGRKYHCNSFETSVLPAGTYNLHFWAKGHPNFTTAKLKINETMEFDVDDVKGENFDLKITLANPSRIKFKADYINVDEVRVCPEDAFMTTYTYDPLIGMTSQTNPQGLTTYYEYDDFGRLKYIKDHEGNILEAYDYHYAGE